MIFCQKFWNPSIFSLKENCIYYKGLTEQIFFLGGIICLSIYLSQFISIYLRDAYDKFPEFFLENSLCYCYTSYEITETTFMISD